MLLGLCVFGCFFLYSHFHLYPQRLVFKHLVLWFVFSDIYTCNTLCRYGCPAIKQSIFLQFVIKIIHGRIPAVRLRIRGGTAPQAVDALRRGEVDLAVVAAELSGQQGDLHRVRLRRFSDLLIGGPQHRTLAQGPLGPRELARHPLILMGQGSGTYEMYSRIYLGQGMILRPDIEVESDEIIPALVARGLGIAFVPEFFARPGLEDGSLTLLQPTFALPGRSISAFWQPSRPPAGPAGELLRFLEKGAISGGPTADPA